MKISTNNHHYAKEMKDYKKGKSFSTEYRVFRDSVIELSKIRMKPCLPS